MFVFYPQKQECVAQGLDDIITILIPKNANTLHMVVVVETGTAFPPSRIAKKNVQKLIQIVLIRKMTVQVDLKSTKLVRDRKN